MNELTNEVNEEIVMRELTINELESINGGLCAWDIWKGFPGPGGPVMQIQ